MATSLEWSRRESPGRGDEGRLALATVADAFAGMVTLRRASGGASSDLTTAEREQLIADAREGKLVTVLVDAVTFIQRDKPNRNFVRFSAGALKSLAPSFAGMPVLRDHEQGDAMARAGRIVESKLVDSATEDGAKQIAMTLELTAPWAVEMALRGLMDRFSIGWHSVGDTQCSICGEAMTHGWFFTYTDCEHEIGEAYDGQVCQLEYTDGVGVEVSAVSVPAVVGTGIEDIRAQLSAARAAGPAGLGRRENRMKTFGTLLAVLGLSADADEAAAVTAAEKLKTERDGAKAAAKDASDQLAAATKELTELRAAGKQARIDAALARGLSEGRYLPNGKTEEHLKKLAAAGKLELLEAELADLEPGRAAPIRQPLKSETKDPKPRALELGDLTDEDKAAAARMGVTHEKYLALKREAFPQLAAQA
jgi:hypothetical protein